jgi:hypothetical protein
MPPKHDLVSGQPEVASRLQTAFPRSIAAEVDATLQVIPAAQLPPSEHDIGPVRLHGEVLRVPCRIYSPEPDGLSAATLSDRQRLILACLYTRHHDGHVREKYLGQVLHSEEAWVPPFVLQLVGEYVLEIILVVASQIDCLRTDRYAEFAADNPGFLSLTRQRIISYWNCYFCREFPHFGHHPAFRLLKVLGWWGKRDARRLLNRPRNTGSP